MHTTVGTEPGRPRLLVDVAVETGRAPLAAARVEALVRRVLRGARVSSATISVAFVSPRRSAALHKSLLGVPGATDIITLEYPGQPISGEMYICPEVARQQARAHGVSLREELARLVIHGTLHALGQEHPVDDGRTRSAMWRTQERHLRAAQRAGEI